MLIGEVMEKTPRVSAMENMANRVADRVRNTWLDKKAQGMKAWEVNFFEDPDGIVFLRDCGFPGLVGIDYIVRWWGAKDSDELAGDVQLLWKVRGADDMDIYKTTIRLAERDFVMGTIATEQGKREAFRANFRKAFEIWQGLYAETVSK